MVRNWNLIARELLPLLGASILPTVLVAMGLASAGLSVVLVLGDQHVFTSEDYQTLIAFSGLLVVLGCGVRVVEGFLRRRVVLDVRDAANDPASLHGPERDFSRADRETPGRGDR